MFGLFVYNKRQNGRTNLAQIFCWTSRDHREGLRTIKILKKSFFFKFYKKIKILENPLFFLFNDQK